MNDHYNQMFFTLFGKSGIYTFSVQTLVFLFSTFNLIRFNVSSKLQIWVWQKWLLRSLFHHNLLFSVEIRKIFDLRDVVIAFLNCMQRMRAQSTTEFARISINCQQRMMKFVVQNVNKCLFDSCLLLFFWPPFFCSIGLIISFECLQFKTREKWWNNVGGGAIEN